MRKYCGICCFEILLLFSPKEARVSLPTRNPVFVYSSPYEGFRLDAPVCEVRDQYRRLYSPTELQSSGADLRIFGHVKRRLRGRGARRCIVHLSCSVCRYLLEILGEGRSRWRRPTLRPGCSRPTKLPGSSTHRPGRHMYGNQLRS